MEVNMLKVTKTYEELEKELGLESMAEINQIYSKSIREAEENGQKKELTFEEALKVLDECIEYTNSQLEKV